MDDKSKYYGTVTELQEIRKALKYLATSVDNLVEQQKKYDAKVIAEQLTLRFEATVEDIVTNALGSLELIEPSDQRKTQLYDELQQYKREYRWARTYEEKERLRGLINSVMYEINNYY